MTDHRLGLVGSGIDMSLAPAFHELAGELAGLDVRYELIPRNAEDVTDVGAVLAELAASGFRGVNVTVPFKMSAAHAAAELSPEVAVTGVANTVLLNGAGPQRASNTDYTGFIWAYRRLFGTRGPGVVGLPGAGGVGRATAGALVELGVRGLRIYDLVPERSHDLADGLRRRDGALDVVVASSAEEAVTGADGVVNGTPVGMYWNPGAPVDLAAVSGAQRWLFDAIYSPIETPLMARAADVGLVRLTGFDLFLGQAIDAFEIFTGHKLPEEAVAELEARMGVLERQRGV